MAGIVNDQKMIWPWVLKKRSYLHAELDAGVWTVRNLPALGLKVIRSVEEFLEGHEIVVWRLVAFPPQHENRNFCILWKLRLSLYQHGSILQMSSESLKIMSFGDGGFGDRVVRLKGIGVSTAVNGDRLRFLEL